MPNEICIKCGKETAVDVNTHIDFRLGYIEGAGQLCAECFREDNDREHICVPRNYIKRYSNDMELGQKVREFYYDNYNL